MLYMNISFQGYMQYKVKIKMLCETLGKIAKWFYLFKNTIQISGDDILLFICCCQAGKPPENSYSFDYANTRDSIFV